MKTGSEAVSLQENQYDAVVVENDRAKYKEAISLLLCAHPKRTKRPSWEFLAECVLYKLQYELSAL